MTRLLATAFGFPVVVFTFPLLVVAGYWAFIVLGAVDPGGSDGAGLDASDTDALVDEPATSSGYGLGFGGLPLTVAVTVLVSVAWFASLVGVVVIDEIRAPGAVRAALRGLLLPGAVLLGWLCTVGIAAPLRRLFPVIRPPSRADFVGRTCVVRTAHVGPAFGQAEVTAADGSSAVIQVRLAGEAPDAAGWTALIYEYDPDGDCFWITPIDLASAAG